MDATYRKKLILRCRIQNHNVRAQKAYKYKVIYSPGCAGVRRGLARGLARGHAQGWRVSWGQTWTVSRASDSQLPRAEFLLPHPPRLCTWGFSVWFFPPFLFFLKAHWQLLLQGRKCIHLNDLVWK